ncbi:hypothetical protein NDU88_009909 [Pleurodeles waltl]|uniref:ribonuclease H n=1 Tax=Pleurodeles waltl TaxID=8319 RepID=A0AAV7RXY8_PLEWA|nr:hypothetical protein NDU88_009909 [Pleurodeles waltl]
MVPDPSVILTTIPAEDYFSVIDIKNAFFSVLLHPNSQYLTVFTFRVVQLLYRRQPQRYCEPPSIFKRIQRKNLANRSESTLIQYADDILICSPSEDLCGQDMIALLTALAERGYKVKKGKLQYLQKEVSYLSQPVVADCQRITPTCVDSIKDMAPQKTKRGMQKFLGLRSAVGLRLQHAYCPLARGYVKDKSWP